MKILTHYRLLSRFRIALLCGLFMSMLAAFILQSGILDLLFFFDVNDSDILGRGEEVRWFLMAQVLTMERWVNAAFSVLIVLLPILASASVYLFSKEKKGVFYYKFLRNQSHCRVLLTSTLTNAFVCALSFYLVYVSYCFVGFFITTQKIEIARPVLDFIFGTGFSQANPFFFFVLGGSLSVFLFVFVYSLFACSLSLVFRKATLPLILPILYFFGMSQLFAILTTINPLFEVLQPIFTLNFFAYGNAVPLWEFFTPLITPFLISTGLIIYALRKKERYEA